MLNFLSSFFQLPDNRSNIPLDTRLIGPHIVVRMGNPSDWRSWRHIRDMSRSFLVPWEPIWPENGLSYNFFCGLLRRHWRDWRQGRAYSFLILLNGEKGREGVVIGGISLNDIQGGIAQKANLGYWIGRPFAGQGLMHEAAELVCDFAFNSLRLHRIEASCLPHNEPSKNLLKRLGFEEEGYAKDYLQIYGKWEDHVLWGRTSPRPQQLDDKL